jgi:hypothetical protein
MRMEDRFWQKVNKLGADKCWEWTGALNDGYGWFYINGVARSSSRVSAFIHKMIDSVDGGLHVLHKCDNRKCCNPSHLFLGTNAENQADKKTKGRSRTLSRPGELNPMSKLSNDMVKIVRGLYFASQTSQSKLAKMFGVRQPHVSRIVNNVRCGGVL